MYTAGGDQSANTHIRTSERYTRNVRLENLVVAIRMMPKRKFSGIPYMDWGLIEEFSYAKFLQHDFSDRYTSIYDRVNRTAHSKEG